MLSDMQYRQTISQQEWRSTSAFSACTESPSTGFAVLLCLFTLLLASYNPSVFADSGNNNSYNSLNTINTPFYQQFRKKSDDRYRVTSDDLLDQVMPFNGIYEEAIASPEHGDDLAFNYLWLQQHQQGYSQRHGGAAVGKILRMTFKSWYKSYYGGSITSPGVEDDFSSKMSDIDYRLRLSDDRVRLGVEYEF